MRNSLIAVGLFLTGLLIGSIGIVPSEWLGGQLTQFILYLLIIQVGLGLGAGDGLVMLRRELRPRMLLVPVCTILGTLLFSAFASLLLPMWRTTECVALGCGFGYYSLSSVLITELKEASLGLEGATALGTLALLTNIVRELIAIAGAPIFVKFFGKQAPVVAAGVTSMDSVLPSINRYSGAEVVPIALVHGLVLEVSTPLLVTFFCTV